MINLDEKYTDDTLMPFGKYKGTKLTNVPSYYLLFILNKTDNEKLVEYIKDNYEILQREQQER